MNKANIKIIVGYLDADEDAYKINRSNLVVFEGSGQPNEEVDLKNIRLRKDDRWEYRKTIHGQNFTIIKRSKTELLEAIRKLKKSGFKKPGSRRSHNFKDFAERWLEVFKRPTIKEKSAEVYENIINNHLKPLHNLNIEKITLEDLQRILNENSGRMRELTYLTVKQIFKQAYFEDIIKKDISQFLQKGKIERKERRSLLYSEQKKLWEALGTDRLSMLIRFYLLTGCRREEARIEKKDLFQDKDNYFVYIAGTKTEKSKRYVKISQKLFEELNKFEGQIFYTDYKSVEKRFRKFVRNLGLSISIHQLRHTFATNLYILGVPDKQRQLYLGHASIVMTNDVYTHAIDPTLTAENIRNLYADWLPPEF